MSRTRRTSWGDGQPLRLCVSGLVLALVFALLAQGAAVATEPPANAPQRPAPDELPVAAATELELPVPPPEELDLASAIDRILEFAWSLPDDHWDIEILAAALDYDPIAAFTFVRDHIRYEPYAGVLRGAEGTLAARAGNSFDRSLLLAALLDEMLVDYEFAMAELDDEALETVMEQARRGPAVQLDEVAPGTLLDVRAIGQRARRDYALLHQALGPVTPLGDGTDEADAITDARTHVWLRIPFGAETLDLDPTRADAEPGDRPAEPDRLVAGLPEDARHTVDLQLILEELDGDRLTERVILDEQLDPIRASSEEIFLLFEPDLAGYAGAIDAVLSGDERWTPVLLRDGARIEGMAFSAGGRGTDLLGDESDLPEPVSMRLVATIDGPGSEAPRVATHLLFDRRLVEDGSADAIDADALEPLTTAEGVPVVLGTVVNLSVSTGGKDARTTLYRTAQVLDHIEVDLLGAEFATTFELPDRLWPVAAAADLLVLTSEQVLVPAAGSGIGHAYVARPRLYVSTIASASEAPDAAIDIIDLMHDDVRVLPTTPGAATAPAQVWYGALQAALETETALERAAAFEDQPELLGASLAMSQAPEVVDPRIDAVLDAAGASLRADLDRGYVVAIPTGALAPGVWWAIDPGSGVTRAMLEPGLRGVRDAVPSSAADVADTIWQYKDRGSKSKRRRVRPPGGTDRADGFDRRQFQPKKRPGLPPNERLRLPKNKPPPVRSAPRPTCSGKSEYMTVVGCVSLPQAGAFYFLGAVYEASVVAIAHGIAEWLFGDV